MRLWKTQSVFGADEAVAATMEAARSLGRGIGESSAFKQFEAAYEAFQADGVARQRLADLQSREQEIRLAAMWGGADPQEQKELESEWKSFSAMPSNIGYLRAQEEFTVLLREASGKISKEIGLDYGAACSPSGGCC